MCGIVGLFAKSDAVEARLGHDVAAMLIQLSDRGPDSAGMALYRDPVPAGSTKLTLYSPDLREDWSALSRELAAVFGGVSARGAPAAERPPRRTRSHSRSPACWASTDTGSRSSRPSPSPPS